MDEGKNINVSQSEEEKGGSIPLPTWDATGDLTQMPHRYNDDGNPPMFFFLLQSYTIHVNDLFQDENGEFRRKVTTLHPRLLVLLQ